LRVSFSIFCSPPKFSLIKTASNSLRMGMRGMFLYLNTNGGKIGQKMQYTFA